MKQFCLCFAAVFCFMPYVLSQPVACKDSSYRKIYGSGSDTVKGYHHIALSNNRTVIAGKYKTIGAAVSDGWMMLVQEDGTPVKSSRTASPDAAKSFAWVQGVSLQNNASVLLGLLYDKFTHDGNELVVTKRDGNLNPAWTRRYRLNPAVLGSLNELFITNQFLWEAGNGDVILLINGVHPGGLMANFHMVARISSTDGSLVWHKTFIPVHQESFGYASGAFQTGNSLVITGYMDMPPITTGDVPAVYAMRLNWADGSLQLLKRYRYHNNDFGAWGNSFDQYKGRRVAGGGYEIYGEEYQQGHTEDREYIAVQLNENLELTGSQSWGIDYTFADNEASIADAAGNFVVLNRGGSGSSATHLSVYNRNGKHRRRRLNTTQNNADWSDEQNGARIAFKPNGNTTVLLNYYNAGRPVTELMQLVPEDTLTGCTGTEVGARMEPISFKLEADPTGWKTIVDNGLEERAVTLTDVALPVTEDAVCKVVVPVMAGALSLGSDAVVCNNDTLVLTATGGLSNYTWPVSYHLLPVNDSTVKVAPDKDTTYIVQALTRRGCTVADTVQVQVWNTPQHFLPADTVICAGSSVVLQPVDVFNAYEWSTGATAASVTVNNAGSYMLKVTDANGCRGEDDIKVALKSCSTYVYIPTGFTPDNNGVNDVLRPAVSGNLASYYFAVYNRWGQCVFASRQPGNGWNGTFKNARQGAGTYTWICKYRFEGGDEKMEKGTVVLIR